MFDGVFTEPHRFNPSDSRATDRAAIGVALAMSAAIFVFTIAGAVTLQALFPAHPDALTPWTLLPVPAP